MPRQSWGEGMETTARLDGTGQPPCFCLEKVPELACHQRPCAGGRWPQPSVPIQLWAGRVLGLLLVEVPLLLIPGHDVQVVKVGVVIHCAAGGVSPEPAWVGGQGLGVGGWCDPLYLKGHKGCLG